MTQRAKIRLLLALLYSQFLPIAISSGTAFHRIDSNPCKQTNATVTGIFHRCSFDPTCRFVVKPTENGSLEKRSTVDDVTKFYNVWEKSYAESKSTKIDIVACY